MSTNTCINCEMLGALPTCNQPECPELPHLTGAKYTKTFTDANGEQTECQVCGYTCDGQSEPCGEGVTTLYAVNYKKWNGTDLEDATCYTCSTPTFRAFKAGGYSYTDAGNPLVRTPSCIGCGLESIGGLNASGDYATAICSGGTTYSSTEIAVYDSQGALVYYNNAVSPSITVTYEQAQAGGIAPSGGFCGAPASL
jgi:hypothetical protein